MNNTGMQDVIGTDIIDTSTKVLRESINKIAIALDAVSKEKYDCKCKLIENATDMSTKEKLIALGQSYNRHATETWQNIINYGVFSLVFVGFISSSPINIKSLRVA